MTDDEYFYPDLSDRVTIEFIKRNEPYKGYWRESEQRIFAFMREYIRKKQLEGPLSLLDAGCGQGRLLHQFHEDFAEIVAVDPDKNRIENARMQADEHGYLHKINFKIGLIEDIPNDTQFDVIFCHHVLQHVPTDMISKIISILKNHLKPGGLLFLAASHSFERKDYYTKTYLKETDVCEERIDEQEFNQLVINNRNILPSHFFTISSLEERLEENQLKLIDTQVYHILDEHEAIPKSIKRDEDLNTFPFTKNLCGRDLFLVATL